MTEEIQDQTTAIAVRADQYLTFGEIQSMGDVFFKSGMFTDLRSAAQAIVKIQAGRELGLGAVYSMQRLYMVEGKLGMAAETMGALIKRSGKYNYRVKEHTDKVCSIMFYEGGKEAYESTFTIEDARRARLVKPNGAWEKYPRALLFSRALSQGARIVAPDAIGGGYTLEELQSIKETNGEAEVPKVIVEPTPTVPDNAPVAQSQSSNYKAADVEIDDENPYGHYLDTCPEHGVDWFTNRYGKRCHKVGESGWCNLSEQLKPILKVRGQQAGFTTNDAFSAWLKTSYDGRTWSKLAEEEQIEVLYKLTGMGEAVGRNPVVAAAVAEGAHVSSVEQEPEQPEEHGDHYGDRLV